MVCAGGEFFGTNYSNPSSSSVVRSQSQSALLFNCTLAVARKLQANTKLQQHIKLIKQVVRQIHAALIERRESAIAAQNRKPPIVYLFYAK
jgi:hypothetical protein